MKINKGWFKKGRIITEEDREFCRKGGFKNRGKVRSEETKRKIRETRLKGNYKGERSGFWGGGRYVSRGYVFIFIPEHPYAIGGGYVMEHRLVMEKSLGRYLERKELVHHLNHDPSDNRIENLMLVTTAEHNKIHIKGRRRCGIRGKFIN